ncbi:DMT family transporter [Amylibacter sp.]|nr:DMT family transporter [Amylibacter sp.]MDA9369094.1 DMT family transporter [bacterium]MDA7846853.1 DMT family transporter [Amylibacter sp.]MDA9310808.1 DMT family transporter [Amylibacter sp.]MDA9369792.1 DMT family transporter [Amylibacter sp.]
MGALELGLLAAMCWGFHDVCVRFISQKTPISACILTVLIVGLIFHIGLMIPTKEITVISKSAFVLATIAGVSFVIASFCLYYAFKRGPVKLVAPLIASYPILSISWAIWIGTPISKFQILAVLAIIFGVSIVAVLSDISEEKIPPIGKTIALSLIAAIAFACTFASGQAAAELSPHMSATLVTRIISIMLCAIIIYFAGLKYWPGKSAIPWLIAMGCADGLALWCVFSAGALENPQYASVTSSIFGLITILLAWIFLKERMTILQWTGCIITFLGVGYLAI